MVHNTTAEVPVILVTFTFVGVTGGPTHKAKEHHNYTALLCFICIRHTFRTNIFNVTAAVSTIIAFTIAETNRWVSCTVTILTTASIISRLHT